MRVQIKQVSTQVQNQKIAVSLKTDSCSAEQKVPEKPEEPTKSNSVRPAKSIPKDLPKWKPVHLRSVFEKINYPAYDPPTPGPGLLLYKDRLEKTLCPNSDFPNFQPRYHKIRDKINSRKETMKNGEQEDFYKNFPPKLKCPKRKPENHRLSFIDDPPYTLLSNYVHNIHNVPKKKPRIKDKIVRHNIKTNDSNHYCRYLLPTWITNHPSVDRNSKVQCQINWN